MTTTDESVLAFIGPDGQTPDAVVERFPGFDVARLVRAHLVELVRRNEVETEAHASGHSTVEERYVLTPRGADAVGLEPESGPN